MKMTFLQLKWFRRCTRKTLISKTGNMYFLLLTVDKQYVKKKQNFVGFKSAKDASKIWLYVNCNLLKMIYPALESGRVFERYSRVILQNYFNDQKVR